MKVPEPVCPIPGFRAYALLALTRERRPDQRLTLYERIDAPPDYPGDRQQRSAPATSSRSSRRARRRWSSWCARTCACSPNSLDVPDRRRRDADGRTVRSPDDVAALLAPEMELLTQEQLRVVLLDTRNRVLDVVFVYQGNVNSTIVRMAEVFREAIVVCAPNVVLVHNHPSGDPSPSPEDAALTKQAVGGRPAPRNRGARPHRDRPRALREP